MNATRLVSKKQRSPRGAAPAFTLLELLLALALSALVFVAIAMAIDLHLRVIDTGRTEIEESQLARAVLRRMADDLRGAVQHQVIDFSTLEGLSSDALSGLQNLASEDDFVGTDLDPNGLGEELLGGGMQSSSSSQDISQSAAPPPIPGIYGNQYELQIDVSRLPRADEFSGVMTLGIGASPVQLPTDIKTVSYFIRPPEMGRDNNFSMTRGGFSDEARLGGLVRREIDRAAGLMAAQNGASALLEELGDVIAPEVTHLEFRYFDGTQWLMEWYSDQMGGLPVAVEIALAVTPQKFLETDEDSPFAASGEDLFTGEVVYRMVVRLPAAKPPSSASETEDLGL
jgi:type II secretory pathway pseudopilin PulG